MPAQVEPTAAHHPFEGARTTVRVAVIVAGSCEHGHSCAKQISDIEDFAHAEGLVSTWARVHADDCKGPKTAAVAA